MAVEKEYKDAYMKNEVSANKHMTFALLFTAALLVIVWLGYFFKVFGVTHDTRLVTIIVIPIIILLLCLPMAFIKTKVLANPRYKYFVLILFIFAVSTLNVIMPKHAVLGWAVCVTLTAHYYNPRMSMIMFFITLFMMLVSIGLGTFFGEFDSNLLSGAINKGEQRIYHNLLAESYPDSPSGRYSYLSALIQVGENRFIKIFTEYYLGRALFTTLVFMVIFSLNRRTKTLMNNEITVNNENQKNRTELEVAKEIQLNTLPAETISSKDVEIVGELKAAKEVGGDLYDYLDIDEDHVAVLIGDVSGKGVPAAMFMMKTITSFRDFASKEKSPSEILKKVNASIFQGNKSSLFVTCFLAILDKRDGKVVYANAGHNPPIIGKNKEYRYLKCNPGFLLGCFKDAFIKDEELTLQPGESLTLYTDGVTEARNKDGEFFGEERFLEVMNKYDYTCVVELHHAIKDGISEFVQDAPQSDDITYLTIKYRGDNYFYKEKEFPAKHENLPDMLSFISNFGKEHNFPEDFKDKLVIVGDELFSNIIKYGYEDSSGDIFVRQLYDVDKKEYAITIIDQGKAFNQLEVDNPEVGSDIKKQQIGGLGLIIVKKIMDEYAYDRINENNILVLKRRIK